MSREEFFGQMARSIKGGLQLKRQYDLIAHLEYVDDELFWRPIIEKTCPDIRVQFMSASMNEGGNTTSGKSQCMKFLNYLDQSFVICVDSDFDYLLGDERMDVDKYIFQTYTYSWENHFCKGLSMRNDVNLPFDFGAFLSQLSHIVYEPLMCVLYGKKYGNSEWTLDKFNSLILQQQVNQPCMLAKNGDMLLKAIDQALTSAIKSLPAYNEQQMAELKNDCAIKGLNEDTAYLFMQGHCVFNLVERIGRFLMNRKDFNGLVLTKSLSLSGYPEIENVQRDLNQMLKS